MTNHDHERALDLIMRRGTEDIAPPDAAWLDSHLESARTAPSYAEDFDRTGHLLRSVAVTATPGAGDERRKRGCRRARCICRSSSRAWC